MYKQNKVKSINGALLDSYTLYAQTKPIGTVVHFHGNAQNLSAHMPFSYWLTEHGFHVIVFDYQGYGDSQGKPSRQATVNDGIAMIHHAQNQFSDLPTFVLGQSLGGAVAYVSAALVKKNGVCAIAIDSSFGSYRRMARASLSQFWLTWPLQWPLSFLVTNDLSPEDYSTFAPFPAIFFHSFDDPVVPTSMGLDFFQAHSGDKEWVKVEAPGHIVAFRIAQHRKDLVAFLKTQAQRCGTID